MGSEEVEGSGEKVGEDEPNEELPEDDSGEDVLESDDEDELESDDEDDFVDFGGFGGLVVLGWGVVL